MPPLARRVALALATSLLIVACGGGGDDEDGAADTTEPGVETTTTTAQLLATDETAESTTSEVAEPDTGPVLPLTGLAGSADRPALAVKIDNHPSARPQVGLNQSDLVIEEVVESNLTRFIAVFHSQDSDPVGPVRSARTQDVVLLAHLGTPLFANSGGNAGTMSAVRSSDDLVNANVDAIPGAYYREGSPRFAPHNLFSNTSDLYAGASDPSGRPPQLFTYLGADDPTPQWAVPTTGVELAYGGVTAIFTWNDAVGGWARTQSGTPHVDGDDVQIAPVNVVVLETEYGRSAADAGSPEARVTGSGRAWVFTQGTVQTGTWAREVPQDVATLTSDSGDTMVLTPGTTWVALPRSGNVTIG